MRNLDLLQQRKAEIVNKINEALKEGNEEMFQQAFTEYTDILQEAVMAEARGLVEAADNQILTGRGARILTSEETRYYQSVIEAMNSGNPQQSLALIDETLPKTVIDAIFEDILETHPLLDAINFQDTGILTEILVSTLDGKFMAVWGKICDRIKGELSAGFEVINLKHNKLTAFIPICKPMLEIGPVWIDRYVRTILAEAIANGLEKTIIDGDGLDEPIGMRRDPAGDMSQDTGYPELAAIPLSEITPETYGAIIADLAVGPNGLNRVVKEVLFIVNPVDYFTKVMPATTVMVNGVWINNILPFPTKIIQSVHVLQNEAVIGLGKRYFFGLGTGKEGKIEYSDHVNFLDDERVYLTKLYGNGKPLDEVSFKRLNITDLKRTLPTVKTVPFADATISALELKDSSDESVAITPTVNGNTHYYTATTNTEKGTLSITAADLNATITAKLNGSNITPLNIEGTEVTWAAGQNTIVITITNKGEEEVYVLIVNCTYRVALATLELEDENEDAVVIEPEVSGDIHYYTATTSTEKGIMSATAIDGDAIITATLNGSSMNLDEEITWVAGQNVVVITIANTAGDITEDYVLVVDCTYGV